MGTKKIVAISGSIRKNASNKKIIEGLRPFMPKSIDYKMFDGIHHLPHFNPDLDEMQPSSEVKRFRQELREADGVIICTPEYIKGIPGVLKNALEWLVSSAELYHKPVAVITAASGGTDAHRGLLLHLSMLQAQVVENGAVHIPGIRAKFDANGQVIDEEVKQLIQALIRGLIQKL